MRLNIFLYLGKIFVLLLDNNRAHTSFNQGLSFLKWKKKVDRRMYAKILLRLIEEIKLEF